jgi:hypothetical protein
VKFFHRYIQEFLAGPTLHQLGVELQQTKQAFDVLAGGDPVAAFVPFVNRYNWLGQPATKQAYNITQNLARNLPGAMMQDWLIHLLTSLLQPYPQLQIFTEVRIRFGYYPLWENGGVAIHSPSERSDLCVGYLVDANHIGTIHPPETPWPRPAVTQLPPGTAVLPLITINSKVRVSQGEFFDWQGRETLMTKGNPHCLSIQVALRREMDEDIVEAAQAFDKWFLIGNGTETNVVPDEAELHRLIHVVETHLTERM